jgi:hypothetical protein
MVKELMNFIGNIPKYNMFAMVNWGGPLYEPFQSDSKHVIYIEHCGESDIKGVCNKIPLVENNIPSRILYKG